MQDHNLKLKTIGIFKFLVLVLSFAFLVLSFKAAADSQVSVISVELSRDRGYDYLDIYTTGWCEVRGLLLEDKLYLEFPGAQLSQKITLPKKKSKRISQLQIENNRLVITLKKKIDYDIVNVFGRNKSVVEIGDRLDSIFASQFAWEDKSTKLKGQPLKPIKLAPIPTAKEPSLQGKTIIIDPGHGGDDPGAFSVSGIPEKALTLKTAQILAEQLRKNGATVYLTRDEDRRSNLKDVVEFANRTAADIFISLHYNSTGSRNISGTETYYYNPVGRRLGENIHESIIRGINRRDRGLHRMPFYVVKNTTMPAVLLEPVYLTCPEEADLAKANEFREKLAASITQGVNNYFRNQGR